MIIRYLKTNHLENPLGYDLGTPVFSYVVEETESKKQKAARILVALDPDFKKIVYDTGESKDIVNTEFALPCEIMSRTRYFWKVQVWGDAGDTAVSDTAWFETPLQMETEQRCFNADWITPDLPKDVQATLVKTFRVERPVKKARMYMVGLGLYELFLNGKKQGDECLLPGFCDYDTWIPYQTFELELIQGENEIEVMLGDGWYKGVYGMRTLVENYGDRLACIGELHIWYNDGLCEVIPTDLSWQVKKSPVVFSGIYPGEVYDTTIDDRERFPVKVIGLDKKKLTPRLNPPITIQEHIIPIAVIHTPARETVLDMGQNMVGWLSFRCSAPRGTKLRFQFGEILQDGNFYNDNLRTAKAEFTYISDGTERIVRQHFTFYGFRFVKVTGWEGGIDLNDFEGLVIHSDMEELGNIETSDPLVNQLFHNAKWGQKGNFLDVPTDCPQRDERYGWTGDAQIFSGTASYNMDTYAFYTKYGRDVYAEQKKLNGSVPDVVPVANYEGDGSTAWGEAATIIPWNVYLHYGNRQILERQYESMKAWVDYMKGEDERYGAKRLWQSGTHYGDWLALDGNIKGGVYGATDPFLISSGYYYYSASIVAKAAAVIGKEKDAEYYGSLADEIKKAFIAEYFTPHGRLAVDTMTAYVVVLYMGLTPDYAYENVCEGLMNKLRKNRYHLETGFVGTPYLCHVLSENGMNDVAYHLLLEKGYPGWLYEVLMGATTVWERWNSVMPDGKISGTEMNSLNHYAYGSIVEWMYREMAGIRPSEEAPGFKKFTIAPKPNYQIREVKASLRSAAGTICSAWKIKDGKLYFSVKVPFDSEAVLILPDAKADAIADQCAGQEGAWKAVQNGKDVSVKLVSGIYEFIYEPTVPYRKIYSLDSPFQELKENEKTREILDKYYFTVHKKLPFEKELYTFREILNGPFTGMSYEQQDELDKLLRKVED